MRLRRTRGVLPMSSVAERTVAAGRPLCGSDMVFDVEGKKGVRLVFVFVLVLVFVEILSEGGEVTRGNAEAIRAGP